MIIQVCHWWRLLVCPCPVVFFILQPNHCPRDQPLTSNGAFTRGSVIFAALLTTCLDAFGEMPAMMMGRPILRKQTNFAMYRPGAIAVANTAADLPFSALRILVFNLIVYLMSHLVRDAGAFFVSLVFCFPYRSSHATYQSFHIINYVAFLALQGLFRTLGLFLSNFDIAFRSAAVFIPNFVEYCGYILPVDSMKRWLFWIYYIVSDSAERLPVPSDARWRTQSVTRGKP